MRQKIVIKIKADNLEFELRARTSKTAYFWTPHLDQGGVVQHYVAKLFFGTHNGWPSNGKGLYIYLMYSSKNSWYITPMTFLLAFKHVKTIHKS